MAFGGYNYGGYPANGGYYPPPMPDQLAQLRGAQMPPMQQPMMGQPVMNQPVPMNNQPVQTMPQPMQQPQQTQQPAMTGPFYVNGDAGARGYIVAPNQTVMLIDADPESNTFWLKSADGAGMPSMRTFDYTERMTAQKPAQAAVNPGVEYVTRADFERLAARADALAQELEALKNRKCACTKKAAVKGDEVDG